MELGDLSRGRFRPAALMFLFKNWRKSFGSTSILASNQIVSKTQKSTNYKFPHSLYFFYLFFTSQFRNTHNHIHRFLHGLQ